MFLSASKTNGNAQRAKPVTSFDVDSSFHTQHAFEGLTLVVGSIPFGGED